MIASVKFGIWGCGMISDFHAKAIAETENARLVCACDKNEASLNSFCSKYGVDGFAVQEEFLSQNIDAVCICLPSGLHFSCAMACIKNKKHVLVEKPVAFTTDEVDTLICEAEKNNVRIGVVSQLRYTKGVMKAKEIVESGKMGKVTLGNALMKYYRSDEYYGQSKWRGTWSMDGGGALMNQGIHGVDILTYLMGNVKSVFAVSKTLVHNIEAEDTLAAVVEYENGAIGTIQATTSVYPGYARRIEICGSKGSIVLNENNIKVCDVEGYESVCDEFNKVQINSSNDPRAIDYTLHQKQIEDFIYAIVNNKSPVIDGYEGKKAVSIIDAIYRSAKTGKKIYL